MFQNTFARSKSNRIGTGLRIVATLCVLGAALGLGTGGYFGGIALAKTIEEVKSAIIILLVLDAILFYFLLFRMIGLMVEIQREEPIDFKRLLYLPIPLKTVYLLNFFMSMFSMGSPFFALGLCGLCIGMTVQLGPIMLLGIPISMVLYLFVSAWSYFLQGWFMQAFQTKRKRRMAMMAISMMTVIPGMGIYILPAALSDTDKLNFVMPAGIEALDIEIEDAEAVLAYEKALKASDQAREDALLAEVQFYAFSVNAFIPIGWMAIGISALADGQIGLALLCLVGLGLVSFAGLYYGYRSTYKHYVAGGNHSGGLRSKRAGPQKKTMAQRIMEWKLPLVSESTSVVASSFLLAQMRHTMIWNILIMPIFFGIFLILPSRQLIGSDTGFLTFLTGDTIMYMVVMMPFFSGMALYQAYFGIDIGMFRAFVLLPGARSRYLLGINIAVFMIVGGIVTGLLLLCMIFMPVSVQSLFIALMQLIYVSLVFSMLGNFVSIYFPFRIDPQNKKNIGFGTAMMMMVVSFVMMFTLALLYIPTMIHLALDSFMINFTQYNGPSMGIIVSLLCVILTSIAYAFALPVQGRLLEQHEKKILASLLQQKP